MSLIQSLSKNRAAELSAAWRELRTLLWRDQEPQIGDEERLETVVKTLGLSEQQAIAALQRVEKIKELIAVGADEVGAAKELEDAGAAHAKLREEFQKALKPWEAKLAKSNERLTAAQAALTSAMGNRQALRENIRTVPELFNFDKMTGKYDALPGLPDEPVQASAAVEATS